MISLQVARKRDRLKAVIRGKVQSGINPSSFRLSAVESPSQPCQGSRIGSDHEPVASNPSITLQPPTNIDVDNGITAIARAPSSINLWESALSTLEESASADDRSQAHTLRDFVKVHCTGAHSTNRGATCSSGDIIEDVKNALEAKKKEAEGAAWTIKLGSRTLVLRDIAARIIDFLDKFKEIGDIGFQYDPVHSALPWAAFRFLLQAVTLSREQSGQILTGMATVAHAHLRASIYHDLYLGQSNRQDCASALRKSIRNLFAAMCSFLGLAISHHSSSLATNTLRGLLNPGELTKCMEKITKTELQVEKYARACEAVLDDVAHQQNGDHFNRLVAVLADLKSRFDDFQVAATTIEAGVGQLVNALKDDQSREILTWISQIPYESDLYNARKGRLEGTCEWLIAHETYVRWRQSSRSTAIWLHGIPGAGKTKLSTKAVDDVASENTPFAYFFCDRNQETRRSPHEVLLSITRQLSSPIGQKSIPVCTVQAYNRKKACGFASEKFNQEECLDLLVQLVDEAPQSFIVIDGLDECDEESRHDILKALDHLVRCSINVVKMFVASRNDKDMMQHFRTSPDLEVGAAHNQGDIEKLVMDRISKSEWAVEEMNPEVRRIVVQLFRNKSGGMFQWATLHINELLTFESNQAILEWLHSLPEGLKAAYDRIYESIGERWRSYANRVFMWLMVSNLTIEPETLCILACQDVNKEFNPNAKLSRGSLLYICRNCVKIDAVTLGERCRFAHLSVQEYLEQRLGRNEALRMSWDISLKYWQWIGTQIRIPEDISRYVGLFMQYESDRYMIEFMRSAEMNEREGDLWALLLKATTGDDVVFGGPVWRTVSRHWTRSYASAPTEMSIFRGPIGVCIYYDIQRPIRYWLEHGIITPSTDSGTTRSLLFFAWEKQHLAICHMLLDAGTNFRGESPGILQSRLVAAIVCAQRSSVSTLVRLLKRLFEDGASAAGLGWAHEKLFTEMTPIEAAQLFLTHGTDPNTVHDDSWKPPLNSAVGRGDSNIEMTKLLLRHGAEVNRCYKLWGTAIQEAANSPDSTETLKLLLTHGADPNLWREEDYSPLQYSVQWNNIEAVRLLINGGAEINATGYVKGTALHTAALEGSDGREIYELLLAHGADPSIKCFAYEVWTQESLYTLWCAPEIQWTAEEIYQIMLERDERIIGADPHTGLVQSTEI